MLSWCCGMVESLVIGAYVLNYLHSIIVNYTHPNNRHKK